MKKQAGFTLIEVMVVVIIVAILASVAMPMYSDYVIRGKLVEATAGLSDGRIKMEQYFQDNLTYAPKGALVPPCPLATQHFTFDCTTTAPTATTFSIVATGKDNLAAYSYTIDQANGKTSTTPLTDPANVQVACWIMKRGDKC